METIKCDQCPRIITADNPHSLVDKYLNHLIKKHILKDENLT